MYTDTVVDRQHGICPNRLDD